MPIALTADTVKSLPLPKIPVYTVATLPTAANFNRHIILVSNGNAGLGCIAVCDGVNWWPITIGTTACAAS